MKDIVIVYQNKPHTIFHYKRIDKYLLTSPAPHGEIWSNEVDVLKKEITKRKKDTAQLTLF